MVDVTLIVLYKVDRVDLILLLFAGAQQDSCREGSHSLLDWMSLQLAIGHREDFLLVLIVETGLPQ